MNEAESLKTEIVAVREQGRSRYPKDLKERVSDYALRRSNEISLTEVSRELDLLYCTLKSWLPKPEPRVAQVTVRSSSTPTITTPSGFEITGLELDDLVLVIRSLQ